MNPMKRPILARLLAIISTFSASACSHRLPLMKAEEIHSRTNIFGVISTADATGITITETTLRAERAKWVISFPGFDHTTEATGYQQRREKESPTSTKIP